MPRQFIHVVQEEPPQRCVQHDGVVYLRTGYCCHCGECCQSGDPFAVAQTHPPSPCAKLTTDARGAYQCAGRDTHVYNIGCNVWPSTPSHLDRYPSCTYRFELVSNGH